MSLPCLVVKQPGASLVITGQKPLENRGKPWPKTIKLPATLLIMAGKGQWSEEEVESQEAGLLSVMSREDMAKMILGMRLGAMSQGAILGTVRVTGCITDSDSPWAIPGQHHYLLADPKPFDKPIPYPAGRLGVFQAPDVEALHRPHDGTTRRVDCREELPDVMITRQGGPWGNPYKVRKIAGSWWVVWGDGVGDTSGPWPSERRAAEASCDLFRLGIKKDEALMARLHELEGLRLGCYCGAGEPCHGGVLVKLVEERA